MIQVTILSARRVPDSDAIAVADIVLDDVVQVAGVQIMDNAGRAFAVAPRRRHGDRGRVLQWSPALGAELAAAVLARLDGRTAVSGPDPIDHQATAAALAALTADSSGEPWPRDCPPVDPGGRPPGRLPVNPDPTTESKETTP